MIGDNKIASSYLKRVFTHAGNTVNVEEDFKQAMDAIQAEPPDFVMMEANLPGSSPVDAPKRVEEIREFAPAVMYTAYGNYTREDEFMKALKDLREGKSSAERYISLIEQLLEVKL